MNKSPAVFYHYLWMLTVALLVSGFILPARYDMPYPQTLGPTFDPIVKQDYVRDISAGKPEVVVIGDSVVVFGVDQNTLTQELGVESYAMGMPGSTSAAWYLMLKNIVVESNPRPKYVILPFRDTILTLPTYRTTGYYFEIVDNFAQTREPVVTQLAYINALSPAEKIAEQYLPIYSARWKMRDGLDARLRYAASAAMFDCAAPCVNDALNYIFGKQQGVDVTALNNAVDDSQKILYSAEAYDFEKQIDKSFVPYMIQLAQENNITLVFVRTKTLVYPKYSSEPSGLRSYSQALAEYLSGQEHVAFINLAHDERLVPAYYLTTLHFNAEGKQVFTKILAEELKKIMK
jgi:hypothetical protein